MRNRLGAMRGRVAFWALAGVALLVSHDAIFLVQRGPGEALTRALRTAGHGYWGVASALLAAAGILAAIWVSIRILSLRHRARQLEVTTARLQTRPYLYRAATTWVRLAAVVAIGFVIQESLEHLAMHGHLIGLGALTGPEYPLAVPVIGLITLVGASLAALFTTAEQELLKRIVAALRTHPTRAPREISRPPACLLHQPMTPLARALASRAPPSVLSV